MSGMVRRRDLILPPSVSSAWDSEWVFTDGTPDAAGWTRETTGGTHTMTASGLKLVKNTYSKNVSVTHGIVEARFQIANERTSTSDTRAYLRIGDGANAVAVVFRNYGSSKIRLCDNSNVNNGTVIGTWEFGGEYVVRLTIDGAVGAVEVNGVTLKDDVSTASMYDKGTLRFGHPDSYGSALWQYVKYRTNS